MFTSIMPRESNEWNSPIVLCSTDISFHFFGMINYYSHSLIFDIILTQQSLGLDSGVVKHVFWSFTIFVRFFYTNVIITDNFTTEFSLIINTCWWCQRLKKLVDSQPQRDAQIDARSARCMQQHFSYINSPCYARFDTAESRVCRQPGRHNVFSRILFANRSCVGVCVLCTNGEPIQNL